MNLLYAVFRLITGVRYDSVWFISMSVWYFALGGMKAYLTVCLHLAEDRDRDFERKCYRRTAKMLLLLNFPMGIMTTLMIVQNRSFAYPGYVILFSAFYTLWSVVNSVVNLTRFRKLGSLILSASKALNLVAALMSVLGLQTALLPAFCETEEQRQRLNTMTGSLVYVAVIVVSGMMLIRSRRDKKRHKNDSLQQR